MRPITTSTRDKFRSRRLQRLALDAALAVGRAYIGRPNTAEARAVIAAKMADAQQKTLGRYRHLLA